MPRAMWDGNHESMSYSCAQMYFAVQRSLLASLITLILPLLITYFSWMVASCCDDLCGRVFLQVLILMWCGTIIFCIVIWIIGIAMAISATEADSCHDLFLCCLNACIWSLVILCTECAFDVMSGERMVQIPEEPLPDHYAALGVPPNADTDTIKKASKKLSLQWHPDKNAKDPAMQKRCHDRMAEINEAKDTLLDADKRAVYDTKRMHVPLKPTATAQYAQQENMRAARTARFSGARSSNPT